MIWSLEDSYDLEILIKERLIVRGWYLKLWMVKLYKVRMWFEKSIKN